MTDEILFDVSGGVATVTMNRPKALNALTLDMIRAFAPKLSAWRDDDAIKAVIIKGAGEKAFCAGGDVRAVRNSIVIDNDGKAPSELSENFFYEEYQLNQQIHNFPKPYIALLDGVTMGGGVGLSVHGSHRVTSEKMLFAMPETGIGLFPDVGGGWFLPRCPGSIGMYLALTGDRLDAAGTIAVGACTHYVKSEKIAALEEALKSATWDGDASAVVDRVLAQFAEDAGPAEIEGKIDEINALFSGDSTGAIMKSLEDAAAGGSEFAKASLETIGSKSPTSVRITFEQIKRGAAMETIEDVLTMEYRLSQHCMAGNDFREGIRALLVDKDHQPKWSPAALADVSDEDVAAYFEPAAHRELVFN